MSDKPASPFAGIKLSEQTPLAAPGTDQRLFTAQPPRQKAAVPTSGQPTNLPSKEPRKEGTKVLQQQESSTQFDINEVAYRNNTYSFTDEELDALEDAKIALRRHHGLNATKNNLIRLGIHVLLEDYHANKANSIVVKRLKKREI